MTVKYKIYGLTAEEAQIGIQIASHIKQHEQWYSAYRARTDGIQRGNCEREMAHHACEAERLIRKLNSVLYFRNR